ncbi:hypothetical protein PSN45_000784 [Yamadazyma tenuis]|uniref:uncharacterized protein n=1 Tax=Candida tenuis TaxID=2315449 RepID=UPI0027AA97A1|nr:hypothetical protein PSN45_000784 [Yamadazyma tenuis]
MKRANRESYDIATPPLSPEPLEECPQAYKKGCFPQTKRVPEAVIPTSRAKCLTSEISSLLNNLVHREEFMTDDPCVELLVFLDAQGNQYMDDLVSTWSHLDTRIRVILVTPNLSALEQVQVTVTNNIQCVQLSKHFKVLDPLGGGDYPLNYLTIVCNNLTRVQVPIRLNTHNPFERFGVGLKELPSFLHDVLPHIL